MNLLNYPKTIAKMLDNHTVSTDETIAKNKVEKGVPMGHCVSENEELLWVFHRMKFLEAALKKEVGEEKFSKLYAADRETWNENHTKNS